MRSWGVLLPKTQHDARDTYVMGVMHNEVIDLLLAFGRDAVQTIHQAAGFAGSTQ